MAGADVVITLLHYKSVFNGHKEVEAFVVYYFEQIIGNEWEIKWEAMVESNLLLVPGL